MNDIAVIILAAGKGTRMESDLAKVLHPVAGKSMVNHVVETAKAVAQDHIHVVVGHQADTVEAEISRCHTVHYAYQKELLGTGDAVKSALPGLDTAILSVLVLCGDVPLIQRETLQQFVAAHRASGVSLTVLAVEVDDPTGYGRIIQDDSGGLLAIREEADASNDEKKIKLVNSGIYCFDRRFLENGIQRIENNNKQGEYYLTDLVEIAVSQNAGTRVVAIQDPDQVMGVNTLAQLARAEALFSKAHDQNKNAHLLVF